MGFRVWGLGFGVRVLGLGSQSYGSRVFWLRDLHVFPIRPCPADTAAMEEGKLACCIAYCARRAQRNRYEVVACQLWEALLLLPSNDSIPRKSRKVCLYDALQLGKGDERSLVPTSVRSGLKATSEVETQTSQAVYSEEECKVWSQRVFNNVLADTMVSVRKLQTRVRELECQTTATTDAPLAVSSLCAVQFSPSAGGRECESFPLVGSGSNNDSSIHSCLPIPSHGSVDRSDGSVASLQALREAHAEARKAQKILRRQERLSRLQSTTDDRGGWIRN